VIDGHERETRVHGRIDHGQVQTIDLRDGRPVMDRRSAERVDADAEPGGFDRLDIDNVQEIAHVVEDVVPLVRRGCLQRLFVDDSLDACVARFQQLIARF